MHAGMGILRSTLHQMLILPRHQPWPCPLLLFFPSFVPSGWGFFNIVFPVCVPVPTVPGGPPVWSTTAFLPCAGRFPVETGATFARRVRCDDTNASTVRLIFACVSGPIVFVPGLLTTVTVAGGVGSCSHYVAFTNCLGTVEWTRDRTGKCMPLTFLYYRVYPDSEDRVFTAPMI